MFFPPKNNSLLMGQYFYVSKRTLCEPYRDWIEHIDNDGLIRYKFILNSERLLPTSPKALTEVLVSKNYDFEKPIQLRLALGKVIGQGIILQEDADHKHQRKHMGPAFSTAHIKALYPVFWSKAKELADELASNVTRSSSDGELSPEIDVGEWAARATLDIIGIAAMGQDFGCIRDPENELSTCYRNLRNVLLAKTKPGVKMLLSLLFSSGDLRLIKGNDDGLDAGGASVRRIARDQVQKKREACKEGLSPGIDILSILLQSDAFSDEELVDQAMTLLMAGHETTAASITWAMYALCRFPEVQSRLRREIFETFPTLTHGQTGDDNMGAKEMIDRLPYLSAVCNEVLRLYPPGPRTIRMANKDTTILGQHVPKGTPVIVSPWAINA
ncbi:putative cytochrome p450 97b3 [Diaporthe ampelina]|uniref:Putative cytochrome p450 97b3 n=1 Tax=Diaporthe ampelina TaxID=1214573 RepID=A0A0G2FG78_9PEZI|nr:putative cytochrome p450 97b3 [Diaporthe ampelina]